jgi:O-antigen/teichoic acid export membrane protein
MLTQIKRVLRHSVVYGTATVLRQAISFLLLPLYTHYITPSEYGILETLTLLSTLLVIFFSTQLNVALVRFYMHNQDDEDRVLLIGTAFVASLVIGLVLCAFIFAFSQPISEMLLESAQHNLLIQITLLASLFDAWATIPLAILRSKEQSVKYVVVTISNFTLGLILNVYFVASLELGVRGILFGKVISSVISCFVAVAMIWKHLSFRFSWFELGRLLQYSIPNIPAGLIFFVLNLSDRFLLKTFAGLHELGVYALGRRMGGSIGMLAGAFLIAWPPIAFSIYYKETAVKAKYIYSRMLTYIVGGLFFLTLGLSVLAPEIIDIMSSAEFSEAYRVVPVIAVSQILYVINAVTGLGLRLMNKMQYHPLMVGLAALVCLLLGLLFIPVYDMMGAAWVIFISYLVMWLGEYLASQKFYPVQYEWGRIFKMMLAALMVYMISLLVSGDSLVITVVLKLVLMILYPGLLYLFRFYKPEEIHKLRVMPQTLSVFVQTKLKLPEDV